MGNSEVGHLNLGAGAVVKQDITRIDDAVEDGSFAENEALRDANTAARESGRLHLLGLVSDGGVHASMEHLRAIVEAARGQGVPDIVIHAFTDGRDTHPDSGAGYLAEVDGWDGARVATVSGRYFAMDRDRRWDRTKRAWDALVHGASDVPDADSGEAAVRAAYERGETDEFIQPTLVGEEGRIRDGDAVVFFNFRPDRARQLTRALGEDGFDEFDLGERPRVSLTTLTSYQEDWDYPVAFPPARPSLTLASVLAERGIAQLHVAETEKYAHVTYFFNGGEENPYEGEERRLVDSPRDVATYDEKPEMSAEAAADAFVEEWAGRRLRLRRHQLREPGHGRPHRRHPRGRARDRDRGRLPRPRAGGGARQGRRLHRDRRPRERGQHARAGRQPEHRPLDEPGADRGHGRRAGLRDGGALADVAPTVLELLGQEQPAAMTGRSLLQ